jgi:urea transport system ATP-binding protein
VSLRPKPGKVTVLLGRNGVGKTTLLKSLMGVVPIKTGSIEFDGKPTSGRHAYERARAGIGFVPQGREIFGRLTVEENLRMGLAYKSGSTPIPAELFELFPVLKQMLHRRGGDLSGGQQQQLAIARALAAGPKLLILDEPTEGIQPSIIKDIGRVIRMLADRGTMAIVLVEQYYDFAGTGRPVPGDGARRGGFGHFYAYAPEKIEYAIDRYAMEVKRQMDVLDRRLAEVPYVAGDAYTIADMAIWPWYGSWPRACCTSRRVPAGAHLHECGALGRAPVRAPGGAARPHGQPRAGRPRQPVARAPRRQRFRHQGRRTSWCDGQFQARRLQIACRPAK